MVAGGAEVGVEGGGGDESAVVLDEVGVEGGVGGGGGVGDGAVVAEGVEGIGDVVDVGGVGEDVVGHEFVVVAVAKRGAGVGAILLDRGEVEGIVGFSSAGGGEVGEFAVGGGIVFGGALC